MPPTPPPTAAAASAVSVSAVSVSAASVSAASAASAESQAAAARCRPSPAAPPFVPRALASCSDAAPAPPPTTPPPAPAARPGRPRGNLPPKDVSCKFFEAGYCSRGKECWYRHDPASVRAPPDSSKPVDGAKRRSSSSPSAGDDVKGKGRAVDDDNETVAAATAAAATPAVVAELPQSSESCAICFEVPITYGLLTTCDHVFCLSCIRSWRSSSDKTPSSSRRPTPFEAADPEQNVLKQTSKTCPLCRVRSKFIIPSSIFPTPPRVVKGEGNNGSGSGSGGEQPVNELKEAIVTRYLEKLQTIPCRYFTTSLSTTTNSGPSNNPPNPRCPFNNECHYAHTDPTTGTPYTFSETQLNAQRRHHHNSRRLLPHHHHHHHNNSGNTRDRRRFVQRLIMGVYNSEIRNPISEADAVSMVRMILEDHPSPSGPSSSHAAGAGSSSSAPAGANAAAGGASSSSANATGQPAAGGTGRNQRAGGRRRRQHSEWVDIIDPGDEAEGGGDIIGVGWSDEDAFVGGVLGMGILAAGGWGGFAGIEEDDEDEEGMPDLTSGW